MNPFVHQKPNSNQALRDAIYDGAVFLTDATAESSLLVDLVHDTIVDELGPDYRHAHIEHSELELFERVGRLRKRIYLDEAFHELVRSLVSTYGFEGYAFDPARLRVVIHDGHLNRRAAPVYYGHRDTWYGHPQSLITWWIPIDDLGEDETFEFYPEKFESVVPNDSEVFDYDRWTANGWGLKIGWQNRDDGVTAKYPSVTREFDPGPRFGFSCKRAQNLLFAGAHYHKTKPQSLGTTRFSLDFRLVVLADARDGAGAPNVDNRSTGSCLVDYIQG